MSVGESWSEGIGRTAPAYARTVPAAFSCSCRPEPSRRFRPPRSRRICAPRSAATFDTDPGAGGRASAFRTAQGICPRPVVRQIRPGATVIETLRRTRPTRKRAGRPSIDAQISHCNPVINRHATTDADTPRNASSNLFTRVGSGWCPPGRPRGSGREGNPSRPDSRRRETWHRGSLPASPAGRYARAVHGGGQRRAMM